MPIDIERALHATIPVRSSEWGVDDIILYHLGIGAGHHCPSDKTELRYVFENELIVLPTFAVAPISPMLRDFNLIDGIDIDHNLIVHGEQQLEVHRPLPVRAFISSEMKVVGIEDKRSGALLTFEIISSDAEGPLFTNTVGVFVRGEGGFSEGYEHKPIKKSGSVSGAPPDRPADVITESPTLPSQALIYRLSGDKNPLHVAPDFAAKAGFERPILHGLCTYGIACKSVVDTLLDGDASRVRRYGARFSGIVFPGETIVCSMWREEDRIYLSAVTAERGELVLSNACLWV